MTLNVLWRSNLAADLVADHADLFDADIDFTVETDKDKAKKLDHYEVLVDGNPDAALLDASKLQHVVVPYVGVNDELRENVLARPHLKLYNSHFNDAFVAQHAVALLLACSNRIVEADTSLRRGDWRNRHIDTFESVFLPGKTCLLLGYGAIGKEVETRVRGLGMAVSALRREPQEDSEVKEYGPDELHKALGEADAVVVSLPSTPQTKNMLDEAALQALKPGGILVNVGRGDVIDQHALYEALKSGHLFAAGLDVWWNYPKEKEDRAHTPPADAPFFELSNVVMSPHRANQVQGWAFESLKDVAQTLNALVKGEERNRVDPDKGY
ncbi:2-hydroxyacid dehydrogenase [soil metagenome]